MNMEQVTGYEVIRKEQVKELDSAAWLLKHRKTGARVFLLENDDNNKVFNIAFRTTPENSTGVAHILEHSVLCGSDQYPAKDPFIELAKGSLNTFLNAMTYPDKTMYPVASCNDKDFKNLTSVYLDAVFHPNIYRNEKIFLQEGWHYEMESLDGPITYNGVVYNEMKGALSAPESILNSCIYRALFPHTIYANVSGGDPEYIPDLSYEEFLAFHSTYYHPSNCFLYLYGDMDMAEYLKWIDEAYLSHYEKISVDSSIAEEPAFDKWADESVMYGISEEEEEANHTFLSWNVVTGSVLDQKKYWAFQILEYVLLSAPGAPVKQALLDAGIGEDIMGGFDSGIQQTSFSIVAKGANPDQKEAFVQVIEETLRKLAEEGMNRKSLLAGINSYEFKCREGDFGRWPKGLMYSLQSFDSWLYQEDDPLMHLYYEDTFAFLRKAVEEGYYEELIRTCLLNNPHGALVTLVPKKGYIAEMEERTAAKLNAYKASLSVEEQQQIIENTRKLKEYQETPSSKEELEMIPVLAVDDIEKKVRPVDYEETSIAGQTVLFHDAFTSGIGYLNLVFQADAVSLEDVPYVSLLRSILSFVDTKQHTYQDLSDEINIHCGGLEFGMSAYTEPGTTKNPTLYVNIRSKMMYSQVRWMLTLLREVMFDSDFRGSSKRIREMLAESRSRTQMRFMNGGHSAAIARAESYFSESAYLDEQMSGLDFYDFLDQLYKNFDDRKEALFDKLEEMVHKIFTKENLLISYTAEKEGRDEFVPLAQEFIDALPSKKQEPAVRVYPLSRKNEGLKIPSQVQYVARCGDFAKAGYGFHGAMKVMRTIMDYEYMWIQIRVKGGAYGCMSGMYRDGEAYFVSYRDPNLEQTNEVFCGIPDYLRQFTVDDRDMTKYVIGTISDMDVPMTPRQKGERNLSLYLSHTTEETLQRERDQVLSCTQEDIRGLADAVEAVLSQNYICVVGNEDKIEECSSLFMKTRQMF